MPLPTYATYLHGDAQMVEYTAGADISAGDVIVTNDTPRIAHLDIANGALGALAARGGVYRMPKASGSTTAIAADKKVYWDATNHVVTTTSSGNKGFGVTVKASVDGDTTQVVRHEPF